MGTEVDLQEFSRADRTRYREKVRRCLDVFARMLRESRLRHRGPDDRAWRSSSTSSTTRADPALKSTEALEAIANPSFQTELAQFNLEINVLPRRLGSRGVSGFEDDLRSSLNDAESKANEVHAHMVMIGILPTLEDGHLSPSNVSPNPRYKLLSDQILAARGEDLVIDIQGTERLRTTSDSIMPEAACTSTQLHTQVSPDNFAAYWNASQAISGIQLAIGANSPYLLGKQLWRETRIPLFEQATDTRSEELKEQGVRPRVWFGERWINSIFDLFEENVRYFPALLPITDDEDPLAGARGRRHPVALRAEAAQRHDLPLEPAGLRRRSTACRTCGSRTACSPPDRPSSTRWPTPPSTSGWCARWPRTTGRCGRRCRSRRPRRTSTSRPSTASTRASTGRASARCGATELVLRRLLPMAHAGLERWGVEPDEADRLLDDHRAALRPRPQRRLLVRRPGATPTRRRAPTAPRRCG